MDVENHMKSTSQLLGTLAMMKHEELLLCEQKVDRLKVLLVQDPLNTIINYKFRMAKNRYDQLKKTTHSLVQLQLKMNHITLFSGE